VYHVTYAGHVPALTTEDQIAAVRSWVNKFV
jgi:hypothetical protein